MEDAEREETRMARKLGICFKSPTFDQWPPECHRHFETIRSFSRETFDSFSARDTTEQPWRGDTKSRAISLAHRASTLLGQNRNEAGWRELEEPVLRRFKTEVACSVCRARIWRSETEAYINPSDHYATLLEEKRKKRKPCTCPPIVRSPDVFYEGGASILFEDRVEETIVHDPSLKPHVRKHMPDRIVGLRKTKTLEKVFLDNEDSITMGCSPFNNDGVDPLIFPFLVLEAKSEKKSSGFYEMQNQTRFPIWTLLQLQRTLQDSCHGFDPYDRPLVWFIASRGDEWRIYGCYLTRNERENCVISQLWDGCLTDKDKALQLLLIIDYIADWARDVYRPCIIKQLKSLSTGRAYDTISMTDTSGIFTLREGFARLAPTINEVSLEGCSRDTKLGSIRSAAEFDARVLGLRLDTENIRPFLRLAEGPYVEKRKSQEVARRILELLAQGPEPCVIPGSCVDYLERKWMNDDDATLETRPKPADIPFYTVVEYGTSMSSEETWIIEKQISYLAVSRSALASLFEAASYEKVPSTIRQLEWKPRPCDPEFWVTALNCLLRGSAWQNFMSATACVCVSIQPLPRLNRNYKFIPVMALGLEPISRSSLRGAITDLHRLGYEENFSTYDHPEGLVGSKFEEWVLSRPEPQGLTPKPQDTTFIRVMASRKRASTSESSTEQQCERCDLSNAISHDDYQFHSIRAREPDLQGMALIETWDFATRQHRFCLFVFDPSMLSHTMNDTDLATRLEQMLQRNRLYHTIRHPIPERWITRRDTIWNLPLPYRALTKRQRIAARDWIRELQGDPTNCVRKCEQNYWDDLQLLLHFMKHDYCGWSDAVRKVFEVNKKMGNRYEFYASLDEQEREPMNADNESDDSVIVIS